jgi:hypothetical protein
MSHCKSEPVRSGVRVDLLLGTPASASPQINSQRHSLYEQTRNWGHACVAYSAPAEVDPLR